ncbi:CoA transferase [Mesorhizobium sp. M0134]|uniref:CoA transferase n=1 Tax=unclassified Mesorhizobium TaxID=325217 RepID=UPI00333A2C52
MSDQIGKIVRSALSKGVKIVEMAGISPGPFCGMPLADLGADVIAVEHPDVDVGRRPGALGGFRRINWGKSLVQFLRSAGVISCW